MKIEDAEAIRRERRVESYRRTHRGADHWANSPSGIRHSIATQERIFRMAEQLRERRDWPHAAPFFPVLKALDDAASWELGSDGAPTPTSASAAAMVGYKILFGKLPPVRGHDWPEGFELSSEAESELATFGLRLQGFDPIVFDGNDPAAYLWALFEMNERQAACNEVVERHEHRAVPPRGLAVVCTPVRPAAPAPIPLRDAAQPVGSAR
jgi:hypothetical protein